MDAHISLIQAFVKQPQTSEPAATIKMEDLCSEAAMLSSTVDTPSTCTINFAPETPRPMDPSSSSSKSAKKRKSWGQVLPEPKTNLPPRKRAKTADEKEQRRIERVKRNRLAAHNSRERKRQEVDHLQSEKEALEQRVTDMETELAEYRRLFPQAKVAKAAPLRESIPYQDITSLDALDALDSLDDINTVGPEPSQKSFESPDSLLMSLDSPESATAPSTPGTELMNPESDQTQHSAVSVGFQQFHQFDGKVSVGAEHDYPLQFPSVHDDNTYGLFDFNLFPESDNVLVGGTESFFDSSFEGSTSHTTFGAPNDTEPIDASIFDMQPGAGATLAVSDAPGLAA